LGLEVGSNFRQQWLVWLLGSSCFQVLSFGTFVPRFLVDSCFPELNLVGMVKTKFVTQTDMKIGLIGDEDTVTGMLLAGIGHVDGQGK